MNKSRLILNTVAAIGSIALLSACTNFLNNLDANSNAMMDDSKHQVRVWFVKMDPNGQPTLIPVSRATSSTDKLEDAVSELLKGPEPEEEKTGLASEIPRGTILLDLKHVGDNVELNLSRRFSSGGGSDSIETRLEQLRRTVTDAAGTHKVYLNVEGERLLTAAGEGIEVRQPIN